jgi:hypothetical protein
MGPLRCLLNVVICTVQMQRKESFYVSIALQNNREPFDAVETTYHMFIACSFYRLLQYFINLTFFFSYSNVITVMF